MFSYINYKSVKSKKGPGPFFTGEIYNRKELKKILNVDDDSNEEIIKHGYLHYGKDIVNHLNGVFAFAIWDSQKDELFVARDHLGVKPLFYTMQNNSFIFATTIKEIFQYPGVEKILTAQGISELLGIGPAHTPGTTVFDNIFELKPGHFAVYNRSRIAS